MKKIILIMLSGLFTLSTCFAQDNLDPLNDTGRVKQFYSEKGKEQLQDTTTGWKSTIPSETSNSMYLKGQADAIRYYRGYKGAGTGTLITSLLSPLAGLIPAISCSSTKPKASNLNYPNSELMNNVDYYNGYTQKAKKMKQGKVWGNWCIALGINIVASLLIPADAATQ